MRRLLPLSLLLFIVPIALSACGGQDSSGGATTNATEDPVVVAVQDGDASQLIEALGGDTNDSETSAIVESLLREIPPGFGLRVLETEELERTDQTISERRTYEVTMPQEPARLVTFEILKVRDPERGWLIAAVVPIDQGQDQ